MHLLDQECSAANLFEEVHDNKLLEAVQLCYTETSSLVLDTLFKRYKLIEHFSAMRKYLLLGQGDLIRWVSKISFLLQKCRWIEIFVKSRVYCNKLIQIWSAGLFKKRIALSERMELLDKELSAPTTSLYPHNLA